MKMFDYKHWQGGESVPQLSLQDGYEHGRRRREIEHLR